MKDSFVIYLDRLSEEREEPIDLTVDSDVLNVHENELDFTGDVSVEGKAYLANEHLVIDLSIGATASLPCKICNEMRDYPIDITHTLITRDLSEMKGHTYDFGVDVREAIIIEIPTIFECNSGECPERVEMEKYIVNKETENGSTT